MDFDSTKELTCVEKYLVFSYYIIKVDALETKTISEHLPLNKNIFPTFIKIYLAQISRLRC